jgi:hypothetical protein
MLFARHYKYYFWDVDRYEAQYFRQKMECRNIDPKSHEIGQRL